jgi:tRNA-Thr(GGU) m(6)t(6)A37 methyltransferase TsaA
MEIKLQPIGYIHSPFKEPKGMPIQPVGAKGILGRIEILPEYVEGLVNLDGFSHLILIYYLHKVEGYKLEVVPFLDDKPHGVFATRAPRRPNPLGFSIVKLKKIVENTLYIEEVDILDGTPLLDIKPYIPDFDQHQVVRAGWFEDARGKVNSIRSDSRFTEGE